MSSNQQKRFSLWGLVKVGLGVAVLALALMNVPWQDTAEFHQGDEVITVPGELLGPWDTESVAFLIDQEAELQPSWPADWRSAHSDNRALDLVRDLENPDASQFDWRPGLSTVFSGLALTPILLALTVFFIGICASIVRWWRLLAIAGCGTPLTSVFRLTFLGLFFNLIVPGLTGGDLIKAVMVVRENPERRADAFVSAIVDRVFGLLGLLLLASGVVLASGDRLVELKVPVLALTGVAVVGMVLVLHPLPRKLVRLESWIHRLPQGDRLRRMDMAVQIYGKHPWTLLLAVFISIFNHAVNATAVFIIASSIGAALSLGDTLCAASLASLVAAVPLSPGGLGVEEAVYAYLFVLLGSTSSLGLGVGITKRAVFTVLGLCGGIALLMPGGRKLRTDIQAVRQEQV